MSEIVADGGAIPYVPDDLTIPQFILDTHHPARPTLKKLIPWIVEDATGREIGSDEVSAQCAPLDMHPLRTAGVGGRRWGTSA